MLQQRKRILPLLNLPLIPPIQYLQIPIHLHLQADNRLLSSAQVHPLKRHQLLDRLHHTTVPPQQIHLRHITPRQGRVIPYRRRRRNRIIRGERRRVAPTTGRRGGEVGQRERRVGESVAEGVAGRALGVGVPDEMRAGFVVVVRGQLARRSGDGQGHAGAGVDGAESTSAIAWPPDWPGKKTLSTAALAL